MLYWLELSNSCVWVDWLSCVHGTVYWGWEFIIHDLVLLVFYLLVRVVTHVFRLIWFNCIALVF